MFKNTIRQCAQDVSPQFCVLIPHVCIFTARTFASQPAQCLNCLTPPVILWITSSFTSKDFHDELYLVSCVTRDVSLVYV